MGVSTAKQQKESAVDVTGKTRVLVNALHSRSGGGVTYLRNILPLLSSDPRLEIHIVLHCDQEELFEDVLSGIKVHILAFPHSMVRVLIKEQIEVPLLSRELGAGVVFSPANYGPLFAKNTVVLVRNALGVAHVEDRLGKKVYWAALFIATMLSVIAARRAMAVSTYACQSLTSYLERFLKLRFEIVPHGVSSQFQQAPLKARVSNRLLVVSDIYVQKNIHTLFEALSEVKNKFPTVHLRIAGAPLDEEYAERLKILARRLNVTDEVEFLGSVDTTVLTREYQEAAVFVFPSTVETFGNPLVEAMACGCSIATSNTAAMPEVAGDAAAYFDPRDSNDIAGVIIDLLKNPDKREALSKRAVERSKLYSWDETARKTADILIDAAQR